MLIGIIKNIPLLLQIRITHKNRGQPAYNICHEGVERIIIHGTDRTHLDTEGFQRFQNFAIDLKIPSSILLSHWFLQVETVFHYFARNREEQEWNGDHGYQKLENDDLFEYVNAVDHPDEDDGRGDRHTAEDADT